MKELNTIQTENKLNDVFAVDEPGPGGARHHYVIVQHGDITEDTDKDTLMMGDICPFAGEVLFNGPRKEPDSMFGATDADLLEIVRDRLKDFQSGPFACPQNAEALGYVTSALEALDRRQTDRAARGVLGTNQA